MKASLDQSVPDRGPTDQAESPWTFEVFSKELLEVVGLEPSASVVHPSALLGEDLGFDSLAVVEILLWFDEHHVEVPDQYFELFKTLDDLYRHYEAAFSRGEWR